MQDSSVAPSFYALSSFYSNMNPGAEIESEVSAQTLSQLDSIFESLATEDLMGKDSLYLTCYYLNVYNLGVNKLLLREKGGVLDAEFFQEKKLVIQGNKWSLSELFNGKVLSYVGSPEAYFMVQTGSAFDVLKGTEVYTVEGYEAERKLILSQVMNDSRFIRVKTESHYLLLPEMFSWIGFSSSEEELSFINQYRLQELPTNFKIDHYPWSWKKK